MRQIAISYRRDDSSGITGRIFDRLVAHYGADSVFRDVDNIPIGVDFREHINSILAQTDVTLVVVGKHWFGPLPRRRRRIDDPADPVRVEVETALRNGMPVIPVLVEGGAMPNIDQLPDGLKEFVYRNGLEVDSGRDFEQHIERLIRSMEPILARQVGEQTKAALRAEEEGQQPEAAQQVDEDRQRVEVPPAALEEQSPGDVSSQSRLRASHEGTLVGDRVAPKWMPLARKTALNVVYFVSWPIYFKKFSSTLKYFIMTVWIIFLCLFLYWTYLLAVGTLEHSKQSPIINLLPGGSTRLIR